MSVAQEASGAESGSVPEAAASPEAGPTSTVTASSSSTGTTRQTRQSSQAAATVASTSTSTSTSGGSEAGPSRGYAGSTRGASSTLDSIDAVCNAIHHIAIAATNYQEYYRLTKDSLLPALSQLEQKGTAAGVPGSMIFQSHLQQGLDPLVVLAQSEQTCNGVGYLYILLYRCQAENADPSILVPSIQHFSEVADTRQLSLVTGKVHALALWLQHFCSQQPYAAISPIFNLLIRITNDSPTTLTFLHPLLLYSSLQAGEYETALHLLTNFPVDDMDVRSYPLTYQDNLKYHLYGGTILAVMQRYEEAAELLEVAVTAPSHHGATSLLQIDAYKRLLLVQILKDGKTSSLPKYTSSHLQQTFRQLYSRSYMDFANLYESVASMPSHRMTTVGSTDSRKVAAFAAKHHQLFVDDQNWGLIERCLDMLPSRRLMSLQKVYRTVRLHDIVSLIGLSGNIGGGSDQSSEINSGENSMAVPRIGPYFRDMNEAQAYIERVVQDLIHQRKIQAHIGPSPQSPSELYLTFVYQSRTEKDTLADLQNAIINLSANQARLKSFDDTLSSSKDFIVKLSAQLATKAGPGGPDEMGGSGLQHPDGDEELMTGYGGRGLDMWAE